jgi:hypothetical protein
LILNSETVVEASGNAKGIVNKTSKLEQWGKALENIRNKSAIKLLLF